MRVAVRRGVFDFSACFTWRLPLAHQPQRQFSALTGHLYVAKQYKVRKLYVTLLVCLLCTPVDRYPHIPNTVSLVHSIRLSAMYSAESACYYYWRLTGAYKYPYTTFG